MMHLFGLRLIVLSLIVFSSTSLAEKTDEQKTAEQKAVDAVFANWDNSTSPGAGVGVFKDGKVVYARGYGMANLEYDIPNDENSVFRIGSTSKQFTAACIVLLSEQGKLSLDNGLGAFFSGLPDHMNNITVKQLLHHTSGVRDYLTLSYLKGLGDEDYYTDEDVMKLLSAQKALNFIPGDEHLYSNSGYWLLGQIVQQVAGMDMAAFAEKELFKPLGMNNTHFHNNHKQVVKNRASGYAPSSKAGVFEISMTNLEMIGDGGIFTTINDIKIWDDAFYQSDVLSASFWKTMTEVGVLNNGEALDYASGLLIGEYKGLNTVSHGGAFVGFRAELLRFPEQKFTVAVFANRSDANPTNMAYQVADIYLAKAFKPEKESANDTSSESTNADKEANKEKALTQQQIVGQYEVDPGIVLEITVVDGQLHGYQMWNQKEYDLVAVAGKSNTYQIEGDDAIIFTFTEVEDDQPQLMKVSQGGGDSMWKRIEPVDVSEVDINEFSGIYYSEELRVYYQLYVSEGSIYLKVSENTPIEVSVAGPNQLTLLTTVANFYRQDGQMIGFHLDAGRVKNIEFVKKQPPQD